MLISNAVINILEREHRLLACGETELLGSMKQVPLKNCKVNSLKAAMQYRGFYYSCVSRTSVGRMSTIEIELASPRTNVQTPILA